MPEELVIDSPTTTKTVFDGFSEVEVKVPEADQKIENKDIIQTDKVVNTDKPADVIVDKPIEDGRNFLKEKLGYEDWDSVKNEIETLKTKAQTPSEKQFANEESKRIHDALSDGKIDIVYNFLDTQKRLSELTEGEVTEKNAPKIIKANMLEKYKGLTQEQVDHKFNKQFALPKQPVKSDTEEDEDFEERKVEWKNQVDDIKMDMMIEANLARPELEKLKSELKFPTIAHPEQSEKPLTPEEQAMVQKGIETFVQNADAAINKFEGFNVAYKDNDVDIQSNYPLSNEEKATVLGKMKFLAERNYNSNALFAERWVNDDQTFNFNQIAKDLAILETHDKTAQKFVSDTAAKAKLNFIKDKHQIDLNVVNGQGELQLEDKDKQKKQEDAIWGLN